MKFSVERPGSVPSLRSERSSPLSINPRNVKFGGDGELYPLLVIPVTSA